jgi:acyl-CoA thioester hydrolase
MREALAGKPFSMRACVLDVTDTSVHVYQQIDHASGEPCAAFRTWVDHVDMQSRAPFPWSAATRAALEALKDEAPEGQRPRSLDLSIPPCASATMAMADEINAPTIGRGVVLPQHCDLDGWMMPEFFIGRISDSITNLLFEWRRTLVEPVTDKPQPRTGGAVLEYRIVYRRWPRAGDRLVVRSALSQVKEKMNSYVHWILDPDSGEAWCTSEAMAVALNLDTRKIIAAPPEQQEALKRAIPGGLTV